MDNPDLDLKRLEDRLREFLGRPVELAGAAALCALLAGTLPYAHRDHTFNASMSQYGFDGFAVLGFLLYATVFAYGLAFLGRLRPQLGLPCFWCDRASFWLTLFALVRTYVFLEQVEVSSGGFFFFGWSSSISFSPAIGVLFLAVAPILLWRARTVEKRAASPEAIAAPAGGEMP
ncbi:hypothetical protein FHR90_001853 [Endobacter medicaginis]|uniref:Uncharacterized protein n=1 Tax=Endobacter medicaginis TaxID=1181271 RepID=A0A839V3F7_9PROT|nr:hypothetical protein [Endobacter medicaginis]MBB3174021.1 hypothetical protein [Endobacter medicaginis]MCX5475122.1 hypothetical protein [Endobacter medicaginis]